MCHKNMERRGGGVYTTQLRPFDVGDTFPIFLEQCQGTMYSKPNRPSHFIWFGVHLVGVGYIA
jgi:hypothetical protein